MSNPCFFIGMNKIICFVMAAVLAVVMMEPMEARAAEDDSNVDPEIMAILENSDDPVNDLIMYSNANNVLGDPVTCEVSSGYNWFALMDSDLVQANWSDSGIVEKYDGLLTQRTSLGVDFTFQNLLEGFYEFNGLMFYSIDYTMKVDTSQIASYSGLSYNIDNIFQTEISVFDFGGFVAYVVPLTSSPVLVYESSPVKEKNISLYVVVQGTGEPVYIKPGDRAFSFMAYMYCLQQVYFSDGRVSLLLDVGPTGANKVTVASKTGSFLINNMICNKINHGGVVSAIEDVGGSILSGISVWGQSIVNNIQNFNANVQSWFETQWTNGRQWTDELIEAITGQSGGQSIGTAQDELDNQLNSIENVEQQLSDQVLDKVDVPSISLSSDETGGLNWVVSTINSFYVAFDELHVMFACVVFFSICAVLLFGRRNL